MRNHGLEIAEGSSGVKNLVTARGNSFPSNPNNGELFFREDLNTLFVCVDETTQKWEKSRGSSVFSVNTISERNALSARPGDIATVEDAGNGNSNSFIMNDSMVWIELLAPVDKIDGGNF